MGQNDLYKKLRIISLILAIICMAIAIFRTAKAAEMSSSDKGFLLDLIPDLYNQSQYFDYASSKYEHFLCTTHGSSYLIFFYNDTYKLKFAPTFGFSIDADNIVSGISSYKSIFTLGGSGLDYSFGFFDDNIIVPDSSFYLLFSSNSYFVCCEGVYNSVAYTDSGNRFCNNTFTYYSSSSNGFYPLYSGDCLYCNHDTLLTCNDLWSVSHMLIPKNVDNSFSEDSRLQIFSTLDSAGNEIINFDLSAFDQSSSHGSSSFSDLVVSVDYDGTVQSYSFDSSNSNILDGSSVYVVQVPVTAFGDLSSFEDVFISSVSFSETLYSQSSEPVTTNYNIATSYYLKQTSTPLSPEGITFDNDTVTDKVTVSEITLINDKVNFQEGYYSPAGGGGVPLVIPDGYSVKLVTITGSRSLAAILNDIYNDFPNIFPTLQSIYDTVDDIIDNITSISSTSAAEGFIEDSVKNGNYALYYDIVIYYWAPDSSLGEPDVMYYYLTASGRIRGMSQLLADCYIDINQTAYNTYATYDYLKNRLDDFELKTLAGIESGINLTKISNDWLQSIYNAVSRIDIPVPDPFDDSSILDLLGDIVDGIKSLSSDDDIKSDGYQTYVTWLGKVDELDNLITPHEWANSVFNYVDSLYRLYIGGAGYFDQDSTDLIKNVAGGGTGSVAKYFTGIWDGTYQPHAYNGIGGSS